MDPKALSHLDPKAREAYDRVMDTAAEIHADNTSDASPSASDAPSAIDQLSQPSASEPFDTSIGGLTSSPTVDTPSVFSTAASTPSDPSPSIFTNNAAEPDPTQTNLSATDTSTLDSSASSSFFTNNPIPPVTDVAPTPDLASPTGFPPEPSPPEATISSDNLSTVEPVAPYIPESQDSPSTATMEQPITTQPLPSPAEVNQAAQHESSALLRVLYIVGAVVFFAIYTIFWVKVFNLPFLF